MSKVLKVVAVVVAVAAITVATAGIGTAPGVGAITATVGGIATTAPAVAAVGAGIAGISAGTLLTAASLIGAASSLLAKPPSASMQGQQTKWQADTQAGVPYAVGRTMSGGNIIHQIGYGGNENPYWSAVTVYTCAGPIEGFESFLVEKVPTSFSSGAAVGTYAGYMWMTQQLGAQPTSAALFPPVTAGSMPGWGAAYKLSGFAADIWTLKFDSKGKIYTTGSPPSRARVGKWVKAYDPRKDSTYPGGSGAHRWNDESTWEWTENPWLHGLTWAIGRHSNGIRTVGVGMPLSGIDVANFVNAANVADANSWKCGGVVSSADDKWDVQKMFAQAGGGVPVREGAILSAFVYAPKISLATITEADLADGGIKVPAMLSRRQRINGIIPRYRSEAHDWQVVSGDPVRVATYVTEDGAQRTRESTYALVQDKDQGAQLAAYEVVNAREFGPIEIPLKPAWMIYKIGDCLTLDLPRANLNGQTVIVTNRKLDPQTGVFTMSFMSETTAKHDFALGRTAIAPPTPSLTDRPGVPLAPDVGSWALSGAVLSSGGQTLPALEVTGSSDNPAAEAVVLEIRKFGDADWSAVGSYDVITSRKLLSDGVAAATVYEVAVSYRVRGIVGERLVIGPATAGDLSISVALGVNQFANSAFRFGVSQWGKPWSGEAGNGVLTWSDGKLLLSSPAPDPGADAGFCSVSAYDGGSLLGGWHLFQVRPGQRIAVRARGSVSRTNAHFSGVFRFYDNPTSTPIAEAVGTAFPGYSRDLSSDMQEAAYYVDVPAGAKWLWIEFYGNSISSGDSVTISLESMLFAYIDPAQMIPPVWNEGPTGAYRADVTGENTALDTQYVGGVAVSTVLSNINAALYDAANAQATADGKVDTFYQPSPPAGSLGDLWFDTDDGNKLYRHDGTSWAVSQDAAIGAAITAAAGAQATADGKVTTFIGASAPSPEGVGDLWSNTTTQVLYRWSGSDWEEVAKLGADGINALNISCAPGAITVACTANGTPKAAIPGFQIAVTQGGVDVTASVSYGAVYSSGMSGAAVNSGGAVSVSGMTADSGYIAVPVSHGGASGTARVEYSKSRDGAAYTSDEDVTITTPGTSYGEVARNVLLAGPNGTLQFAWFVSAIVTGGSSAAMDGYLEFSLDGSSWSTIGGTAGASGSFPPGEGLDAFGSATASGSSVSLTNKQNIYVRLLMRRTGGGGLGSVSGSLQTQWSG